MLGYTSMEPSVQPQNVKLRLRQRASLHRTVTGRTTWHVSMVILFARQPALNICC